MKCILLAGQIGVGKSAIASEFADAQGAQVVRVREALAAVLGIEATDRRRLQREGDDLDRRTQGRWLAEYVMATAGDDETVVVDAMRTERQTKMMRRAVRDSVLVYLEASEAVRRARFAAAAAAGDAVKRSVPFGDAMTHPTEVEVRRLKRQADIVVDTDGMTTNDVVSAISAALG